MEFINDYINELAILANYDKQIMNDTWRNVVHLKEEEEKIWIIKSPSESEDEYDTHLPFTDVNKTWLVKPPKKGKKAILRDNIWGMELLVKNTMKETKLEGSSHPILTIADFIFKEHVKRVVSKLEKGRFHITTHDIFTNPDELKYKLINDCNLYLSKAKFKRYMIEICQQLGYDKIGCTLDALELFGCIYKFELYNICKYINIDALIPNSVYSTSTMVYDTYKNVYPFTLNYMSSD